MSTTDANSAAAPPQSSRPTITLPPRPSAEAFFSGAGAGISPGPMTLVSSFFSDGGGSDSDYRSFSQLLAGAMASPLAFGGASRPPFPPPENPGENSGEEGAQKSLGFKQSRPMNLVVARSPMFTIPPGLSPSGFLNSPGFFSPQSPFGMSHQQALAQVTAQAVFAQSQMHMQADYQAPAVTAPTAPANPSVEQPSFTQNEASQQQVVPSVSEPSNAQVETSDISNTDNKKFQPSSMVIDKPADDGYNWRKYGQKQVKGSEFPRSYYKCTHLNCPVKKKVERAPDGHITEIIYKGQHNHEKPQANRRVKENNDSNGNSNVPPKSELNSQGWVGNATKVAESIPDCSVPESDQTSNQGASRLPGSSESEEVGNVDNREEGDDGEPNPKRRNTDVAVSEVPLSQKTVTEPKIIVQTRSEVDLLDDGYRWRKYGQKVVKGNPHPRSYYKCTSAGCNVRKHVERASSDPKAVITTYEGKHNHDVPAARSSSHNTASNNSVPLKPHNPVPQKHPLLKDMDFGSNDQRPVHLRLKEEQIIV
ncbi:probable WRKY transcription factor 4 [Arachis duranensis]|uniref:Probable WRKY transcription factor 4 n=1 Tax=Arachis duranensis TaxID=130453 RepID=A0A6P4DC68_ARADU|nr:probable WRKY transcription factor 4 [Arachis duranensis]XP_025696704.1 probable WRKY transcription factor 4 [Arachis hypogaea]